MFVGTYFPDEAGHYFSAGTLSRALIWLVGPLAAVMFPRLVHSAAKGEKTNLMTLVLAGTAILAIVGSLCLIVVAPYIIPIIYKPEYIHTVKLVLPWYTAAMVPLALANVLLSNLLAKGAFKVVVPLCILAAGYGFALTKFHDSLVMVLQTLGIANLLLLAICGFFTFLGSKSKNASVP
jgi:O-antigen/teichoic acid export membrane protein